MAEFKSFWDQFNVNGKQEPVEQEEATGAEAPDVEGDATEEGDDVLGDEGKKGDDAPNDQSDDDGNDAEDAEDGKGVEERALQARLVC